MGPLEPDQIKPKGPKAACVGPEKISLRQNHSPSNNIGRFSYFFF